MSRVSKLFERQMTLPVFASRAVKAPLPPGAYNPTLINQHGLVYPNLALYQIFYIDLVQLSVLTLFLLIIAFLSIA